MKKITTHFASNSSFLSSKFHHIGIACKNIEKTFNDISIFLPNEFEFSDIIFDEKLNAYLQLISIGNQAHIELVSGEIVENFLKKDTILYHTCFEVGNIKKYSESLESKGFVPITKLMPADLFEGRLIQFFRTPLGLTEILESNHEN